MWLKWLPWKFMVRRLAHSHGFSDPIALLSRVRRFSQPSEVNEPIELMRAGVVMHARGLINSRVIQHNLDWIWPYWINRQFRPQSDAFIPRAFSLTQINLSVRNWTALGLPDCSLYPIVDPRGLVTPLWDGWSVDAWVVSDQGKRMAPSEVLSPVEQSTGLEGNLSVMTACQIGGLSLHTTAEVLQVNQHPVCRIRYTGRSDEAGWLVVSVRPYNPEGISFIHQIEFAPSHRRWIMDDKNTVLLSDTPDKQTMSDYHGGDVSLQLREADGEKTKIVCDVGMATAAAMFKLTPKEERTVEVAVPLERTRNDPSAGCFGQANSAGTLWQNAIGQTCGLSLPYKNFQYLYDVAVKSVVLHSPAEVYPGPYTYKRFWFRDAAFIIDALLRIGLTGRAERLIDHFFSRQTALGYFCSQQGEWDSNGQVLWLMHQFCKTTGRPPGEDWLDPIVHGAKWIQRKRTSRKPQSPHAGLLPAGFSAEHLGPNDYYYWDDFWALAGLEAAAQMLQGTTAEGKASLFSAEADDLRGAIDDSLTGCRRRLGRSAMPASPYRRLDAGAVGSLAAAYPLDLLGPEDERVRDTVEFLMQHCTLDDGFYHDIIHSGINPYLTLHLAQALLRFQDGRCIKLVERIAALASLTGQWPEAVNPRTGGGCMGDGQHVWASAEWILMMVNCFVMEQGDTLVLGAGVFPEWLADDGEIVIGPVATPWGPVSVIVLRDGDHVTIRWDGQWRGEQPKIVVRLPGRKPVCPDADQTSVTLDNRKNQ